jgi:hypothetical protein
MYIWLYEVIARIKGHYTTYQVYAYDLNTYIFMCRLYMVESARFWHLETEDMKPFQENMQSDKRRGKHLRHLLQDGNPTLMPG